MNPRPNTSGLLPRGPGRPKGVPNKATQEVREIARRLVDDPKYRAALKKRLIAGEASVMESTLWHYGYGKPKEQIEHIGLPESFTLIMGDKDHGDGP